MSRTRPPRTANSYVYALLCESQDGKGCVKIGYSQDIAKRVSKLRSTALMPAKYLAIIDVEHRDVALAVEAALHKRFEPRRLTGEWFEFSFRRDEDKRDFNDGCREVFAELLPPGSQTWWTKISLAALDRGYKDQRKRFLESAKRQKRALLSGQYPSAVPACFK